MVLQVIWGSNDLESDGLDKVTSREGSKTVGKGHRCLGWWINLLLARSGIERIYRQVWRAFDTYCINGAVLSHVSALHQECEQGHQAETFAKCKVRTLKGRCIKVNLESMIPIPRPRPKWGKTRSSMLVMILYWSLMTMTRIMMKWVDKTNVILGGDQPHTCVQKWFHSSRAQLGAVQAAPPGANIVKHC